MRTTRQHPSQEDLKIRLEYRNGVMYWRSGVRVKARIGQPAGGLFKSGRILININGVSYLRSRLTYIYHYGDIPENMTVDHINGINNDDRIENLRLCTASYNLANRKSSKFGRKYVYKGVNKTKTGWAATIRKNYKSLHLGTFKTIEEAALAYNQKATELFGEFAYLNEVPNE